MSSEYINKMQKTAALINKILLIVNSIIFVVISTLFMIFINQCIEAYHGNLESFTDYITIDGVTLMQDTRLMLAEKMLPAFVIISIFVFAVAISVFISVSTLRDILRSIENLRPFDGTVSKSLAKLGKIILGIGLLSPVAEFSIEKIISIAYRSVLSTITAQFDGVNILSNGVSIDLTVIFFGMFVILLGYIFHYGEELQQLSDETL